jgi:hypothetical protein
LSSNADGLVHTHRRNASSLLAQDVSNLHRNLPRVSQDVFVPIRVVYIMPIVNLIAEKMW